MSIMENTWYLPEEKLQFRNYPEVHAVSDSIDSLLDFGMTVASALQYYNEGTANKIDIDISALQKSILLCRSVCNTLGTAPKICFDILTELHKLQDIMQNLLYIRNRYGDQYIGKPTENTSETKTNVVG